MEICQYSSVSSFQDGGRSSRGHTLCDMQASLVVPLFVAVMWEGNSDPPCMSARVSVRISMGGS